MEKGGWQTGNRADELWSWGFGKVSTAARQQPQLGGSVAC